MLFSLLHIFFNIIVDCFEFGSSYSKFNEYEVKCFLNIEISYDLLFVENMILYMICEVLIMKNL